MYLVQKSNGFLWKMLLLPSNKQFLFWISDSMTNWSTVIKQDAQALIQIFQELSEIYFKKTHTVLYSEFLSKVAIKFLIYHSCSKTTVSSFSSDLFFKNNLRTWDIKLSLSFISSNENLNLAFQFQWESKLLSKGLNSSIVSSLHIHTPIVLQIQNSLVILQTNPEAIC